MTLLKRYLPRLRHCFGNGHHRLPTGLLLSLLMVSCGGTQQAEVSVDQTDTTQSADTQDQQESGSGGAGQNSGGDGDSEDPGTTDLQQLDDGAAKRLLQDIQSSYKTGTDSSQSTQTFDTVIGEIPDTERPAVITLQYPVDFPYSAALPSSYQSYLVQGLDPSRAYDISISRSFIVVTDETSKHLLCLDLASECTITPVSSAIRLIATGSEHVISITESDLRPAVNEGSLTDPMDLPLFAFPHAGSVGAMGHSYYRATGLTAGNRYLLSLSEEDAAEQSFPVKLNLADAQPCDPDYSTTTQCNFVANAETFEFDIDGWFTLRGGRRFTLQLRQLSESYLFDGAWYEPRELQFRPDFAEFFKVDQYNSYYHFTGLTIGRLYNIALQQPLSTARLYRFDPDSGTSIYLDCLHDGGLDRLAGCSFRAAAESMYFKVSARNSQNGDRYILRLGELPAAEGTVSEPVIIGLGNPFTQHRASVDQTSHYRLTGLIPGERYLLGFSANINFEFSDTRIQCEAANYYACEFIALGNESDVVVTADQPMYFTISLGSTTDNQTLNMSATALPFNGSVHAYYSRYTIDGFLPDTLYIVQIRSSSSPLNMNAWPALSSTYTCSASTGGKPDNTDACLVRTDGSGSLVVRSNGSHLGTGDQLGAHLVLDVLPLPEPDGQYIDTITRTIGDVGDSAATGEIYVPDSADYVETPEVELLVDHSRPRELEIRLISPDGQSLLLSDNSASAPLLTRFSDFAETRADQGIYYRQTLRPITPLHKLRGIDATGTWKLEVRDTVDANIADTTLHRLLGWSLSLSR